MLVVIAIISILATILLSALNKSMEKAREIYCLNNIKQFGYSVTVYSDSFDSFAMPCMLGGATQYSWIDYFRNDGGMNNNIFKCPSMSETECFNPFGGGSLPYSVTYASYTMNVIEKSNWNAAPISSDPDHSAGWGDNSTNPVSLRTINNPSSKIYIVDVLRKLPGYNAGFNSSDATRITSYLETDHGALPLDAGADRRDVGKHHNSGFNALMGDIHGERIKISEPDQWVVTTNL